MTRRQRRRASKRSKGVRVRCERIPCWSGDPAPRTVRCSCSRYVYGTSVMRVTPWDVMGLPWTGQGRVHARGASGRICKGCFAYGGCARMIWLLLFAGGGVLYSTLGCHLLHFFGLVRLLQRGASSPTPMKGVLASLVDLSAMMRVMSPHCHRSMHARETPTHALLVG